MENNCFLDIQNKLQEKMNSVTLDIELKYQNRILYELLQEKNKLSKINKVETDLPEDSKILFHYKYILPLVKEIHLLELKVKERQKKLEERNLKYESAKQGNKILADSLGQDDCVLRKCANDIIHLSQSTANCTNEVVCDSWSVSNVSYSTCFTEDTYLKESLAFTVLNKGVHVRVRIKSKTAFTNIHFLVPTNVSLIVDSDTFIEGLQEKVHATINGDGSVIDVITFVSQHIENDMAPYVIIVPLRKKKKVKKKTEITISDDLN